MKLPTYKDYPGNRGLIATTIAIAILCSCSWSRGQSNSLFSVSLMPQSALAAVTNEPVVPGVFGRLPLQWPHVYGASGYRVIWWPSVGTNNLATNLVHLPYSTNVCLAVSSTNDAVTHINVRLAATNQWSIGAFSTPVVATRAYVDAHQGVPPPVGFELSWNIKTNVTVQSRAIPVTPGLWTKFTNVTQTNRLVIPNDGTDRLLRLGTNLGGHPAYPGGAVPLSIKPIAIWLQPIPPFTPSQSSSVTLGWDASPSPEVTGYKIYYGTQSGTYGNVHNAGNSTQAQIIMLAASTYYFVVVAYAASGLESGFSNEIAYTPSSNYQLPTPTSFRLAP